MVKLLTPVKIGIPSPGNLQKENFISSDVLVIGSGPAGIAAAITCARSGLRTTIVTGASFPGDPLRNEIPDRPSESVHPGIISLLEMLDASDAVRVSSRSVYDGITVSGKHIPLGADESSNWTGDHIDRTLFDRYLAEKAKASGVFFVTEEIIAEITEEKNLVNGIVTSAGKKYFAKYIIDASGHKRVAGKKLKFSEKFYSPPFFVKTGLAQNIHPDFFAQNNTQFIPDADGWTWLAPEPPDRCSWTRLSLTGNKEYHQPKELDPYGSTAENFASNRRWRVFRPLVKEGLILCGDAAGIIDPSAGQGILNALWSGIKAGQCASQCISNPGAEIFLLAQYDDWFIQQYEEKAQRLKNYYAELGILLFEKAEGNS